MPSTAARDHAARALKHLQGAYDEMDQETREHQRPGQHDDHRLGLLSDLVHNWYEFDADHCQAAGALLVPTSGDPIEIRALELQVRITNLIGDFATGEHCDQAEGRAAALELRSAVREVARIAEHFTERQLLLSELAD
jgi:hypothetical protein